MKNETPIQAETKIKSYPAGSINNPRGSHSAYALNRVMDTAERILWDNTATDNERALADCIIALKRNTFNTDY